MYIGALYIYVRLCKGVGLSGTGVRGSCKLLCGYWELNLGSLEEHSVLLTTEPSVSASHWVY